jgi:hypothetical protein
MRPPFRGNRDRSPGAGQWSDEARRVPPNARPFRSALGGTTHYDLQLNFLREVRTPFLRPERQRIPRMTNIESGLPRKRVFTGSERVLVTVKSNMEPLKQF